MNDDNRLAVCGETITSLINLNKTQEEQIIALQAELVLQKMEIIRLKRRNKNASNAASLNLKRLNEQIDTNDALRSDFEWACTERAKLTRKVNSLTDQLRWSTREE